MRSKAWSPVPSLVIHSRWPWTVTPGGATSWKSASQVVFVEGTITPIRLRRLMGGLLGGYDTASWGGPTLTRYDGRRRVLLARTEGVHPAGRLRRPSWPTRSSPSPLSPTLSPP